MTGIWKRYWPVGLLACILVSALTFTLAPYHGNPSALFHIDQKLILQHPAPKNTIILTVIGYDGMEYWQIARNIPIILSPAHWNKLTGVSPGSYAYQRILLPVAAYILAFGQDVALPWSFLFINILALLAVSILLIHYNVRPIYALALSLCPAAMVGLHFSLAEPLSLLFVTWFLLRYQKNQQLTVLDILLLSLIVLSREINILFIAALMGWMLWHRRWRQIMSFIIPVIVFVSWHSVIFSIFHEVPFLWSAQKNAFPGSALFDVIIGRKGYSIYTLSSIALFILFVLPALVLAMRELWQERALALLPTLLLAFLVIMLSMPDHIWGSITSIGRVITPVYPLYILTLHKHDAQLNRLAALALLTVGMMAAFGLGAIHHPFVQQ